MNAFSKLMVTLALSGACFAQAAQPASDAPAPKAAHAARKAKVAAKKHKAKIKAKTNVTTSTSSEDLRQLKDQIHAQQDEINALKQSVAAHDTQAAETKQSAEEAQKSAAAAQEKAAATEAVAASANSKVETVQSDISDLKTSATNTALTIQDEQKRASGLEAVLDRFHFYGDVRIRYENFFQDALIASGSTTGTAYQDRNRFRLRLRFGVDGKLAEDFRAGFALASGSPYDPTSTNQTLSDGNPGSSQAYATTGVDFERMPIYIDKAYVAWNPKAFSEFTMTAGKFGYTWVRTGPVMDSDINPEGFSEKLAFKIQNPILKEVSVVGTQLVLATFDSGSSYPQNLDSWAYGIQAGAKLKLGKRWTMVPTYGFTNFVRPDQAIFNYNGQGYDKSLVGTKVAVSIGGTTTGYAFAPNGMSNCTKNKTYYTGSTANTTPTTGLGFCSQYQYSDFIVSNAIDTGLAWLPLNVVIEYEKNLGAKASPKDGKLHDSLFYSEASLGKLKNKGDVQFGYAYNTSEQDAVIASFAESDQYQPTNTEEHRFFVNWKVRNNAQIGYTQWIGRYLNTTLVSKANNPYMYRGQLDVVYTF